MQGKLGQELAKALLALCTSTISGALLQDFAWVLLGVGDGESRSVPLLFGAGEADAALAAMFSGKINDLKALTSSAVHAETTPLLDAVLLGPPGRISPPFQSLLLSRPWEV
jgi:hypothetical protein